jgi:hypothetical protein
MWGCVGLIAAFTRGSVIEHNHIFDLPYSGMALGMSGFTWPTVGDQNAGYRVERNRLHDVCQVLADGGAIYIKDRAPGSVVCGNVVSDVPGAIGTGRRMGIYLDDGSAGWRVADNVVFPMTGRKWTDHLRLHKTGRIEIGKNYWLVTATQWDQLRSKRSFDASRTNFALVTGLPDKVAEIVRGAGPREPYRVRWETGAKTAGDQYAR